jgi:2-keto-4-pentenoate hydratase/2-oxohepta-3-ene-1,7-dioic acid hydratase in catechol pathway
MIGANYREHVAEAADFTNGAPPSQPVLVAKAPSAITGPYDDVVRPPETEQLDYEVELAVVIGKPGRHIPQERALDHVFGYTVANDVSARDVLVGESARSPLYLQLLRGKGYDTFLPAGPWLVTADAVPDPQALGLRLWVNDELRQDGSTDQMIVDVAGAVASASEGMALRPGDVLLTGTPGGVAYGMPTPSYLEPGDVVRAEITGLGHLENRIVEEERACPTHSAGWRLSR